MVSTMPPELRAYWLGEGLARWATTPTPYRSLLAALLEEGVPERKAHGTAANLYHDHFGTWPGKHDGAGKQPWDHVADRHAAARGRKGSG